jgi:hypothetical protein
MYLVFRVTSNPAEYKYQCAAKHILIAKIHIIHIVINNKSYLQVYLFKAYKTHYTNYILKYRLNKYICHVRHKP